MNRWSRSWELGKSGVNQGGSYTEKWEIGRMEDEVGVTENMG